MSTSKGSIVSFTINGETFESKGTLEVVVPPERCDGCRESYSCCRRWDPGCDTCCNCGRVLRYVGTITGVIVTTAAEMAANEKAMEAYVWRLRWIEMWRIVGVLAAIDLGFEEELCEAVEAERDPESL